MKRSLNEICSDLRKAARGAGYPVGLSEDIARAGMALIEAGQDGVSAVAGILPEQAGENLNGTALAGPSLFECLIAGEAFAEPQQVEAPLLLCGFALYMARQHECGFRLEFGDGSALEVGPSGFSGNWPKPGTGLNVTVKLLDETSIAPENDKGRRSVTKGMEINEDCLPLIKRWAMETCVPATEASRLMGAGAGLTDND